MTPGVGLCFLLRYIFSYTRIISTVGVTGGAGASSHQVSSPGPAQADQKLSLGSVSSQAIALTTHFWKNKIYFWFQLRMEQERTHSSEQLTLFPFRAAVSGGNAAVYSRTDAGRLERRVRVHGVPELLPRHARVGELQGFY